MGNVCVKCGQKIGALANFGTDKEPLCYDCKNGIVSNNLDANIKKYSNRFNINLGGITFSNKSGFFGKGIIGLTNEEVCFVGKKKSNGFFRFFLWVLIAIVPAILFSYLKVANIFYSPYFQMLLDFWVLIPSVIIVLFIGSKREFIVPISSIFRMNRKGKKISLSIKQKNICRQFVFQASNDSDSMQIELLLRKKN